MLVYEDELGVSQYRWDNDECIGKFYPGIVRVALAQRLPDDLARLIFNDYFRHHLRECRHLGYEMHYRLKSVCRALHLDTRGNGLALKRRIFDELGVCTYTPKEYRSLLNWAVHYRRDEEDGVRVFTADQCDAMQLGEAPKAVLEHHHAAMALLLLERPELNFLANLPEVNQTEIKRCAARFRVRV